MPTEVRVKIDCEGRECGKCNQVYPFITNEREGYKCGLFSLTIDTGRWLQTKAGRPQRCAACLAAEVPAKGDEHAA
jgi:hypothetical protein